MSSVIEGINEIINGRIREVLQDIVSHHPQLNLETLESKYCVQSYSPTKKEKKKKKNKPPSPECRCMAKKADGLQCTRRRKTSSDVLPRGSEYCGKHINNIKFGRVDDNLIHQGTNYKKTRRVNIEGEYYLVDDDNLVYSYNKNNPTLMGKYIDGKLITTCELLNLVDIES